MNTNCSHFLSDLSSKDVTVIERQRVYSGFFKLDQVKFNHVRFDKGIQKNVTREILIRCDAVCVLPFDPILKEVVLIEQIRIAALGKTDTPWMIETVAGLIDQVSEIPEAVAKREALEEAGIVLNELHHICDYFGSAGGSNEKTHLYIGRCDTKNIGGIHGLATENEDIRAFSISLDSALDLLQAGKIQNAGLIIALLWLNQNQSIFS